MVLQYMNEGSLDCGKISQIKQVTFQMIFLPKI